MTNPTITPYTEEYVELCFTTWYSAGCPTSANKLREILPKDIYGRVPSNTVLNIWLQKKGWKERAEILNSKAIQISDDALIQQKAEMFSRQAQYGKELQEKGLEYLKVDGFDSAAAAVQAIIKGAELERSSRGINELLRKMSKMTDADLKEEILRLASRASEHGQIIDAEEIPEEENKKEDENTDDQGI